MYNFLIPGKDDFPINVDLYPGRQEGPCPVLIYVHGFNGFKDWGNFTLLADAFCRAGYAVIAFNFSHNGTSPDHPDEFVDLHAFGLNNYTTELYDLEQVVKWVKNGDHPYKRLLDVEKMTLLGHSRGGGISIIYASEDPAIKALITWASVSECKTPWSNWPESRIHAWAETGVEYYSNQRTGQSMPLYYQLHQDFTDHADRLNIQRAITSLNIPMLICHGSKDTAVPVSHAGRLQQWQPQAKLWIVESDHTFDRKHPGLGSDLPDATKKAVDATLQFLNDFMMV
ncbi:MAG: alpha/beta fold hydrolase [Chitinophagaceae bacterium]|nr:alpha/beta fold hydrolase [Chitinophagaceae bacterium]